MFNPHYPNLFALGFTEMNAGGHFFFDEMASMVASSIHMQAQAKHDWARAAPALLSRSDFRGPLGLIDSPRHAGYLDAKTFLRVCRDVHRRMGWPQPAGL